MPILEEIGIANKFYEIVNMMKWGKLFFMKYNADKNRMYKLVPLS